VAPPFSPGAPQFGPMPRTAGRPDRASRPSGCPPCRRGSASARPLGKDADADALVDVGCGQPFSQADRGVLGHRVRDGSKITSRPAADATLSKVAVVTGGARAVSGLISFVSNAGIAIDGGIDTPTPRRPPSRRRGRPPVHTSENQALVAREQGLTRDFHGRDAEAGGPSLHCGTWTHRRKDQQ
jgi:hypothetical protein